MNVIVWQLYKDFGWTVFFLKVNWLYKGVLSFELCREFN